MLVYQMVMFGTGNPQESQEHYMSTTYSHEFSLSQSGALASKTGHCNTKVVQVSTLPQMWHFLKDVCRCELAKHRKAVPDRSEKKRMACFFCQVSLIQFEDVLNYHLMRLLGGFNDGAAILGLLVEMKPSRVRLCARLQCWRCGKDFVMNTC